MPASLAIPFAVETARLNPIRIPVRNLVAARSDQISLAIQLYNPDGSVPDLLGQQVTVTVVRDCTSGMTWGSDHDYGLAWATYDQRPVFQGPATVTDDASGLATITIPPGICWRGRYRLEIALGDQTSSYVLAHGILDVLRSVPVPVAPAPALASISNGVLYPDTALALSAQGLVFTDETGVPFLIANTYPPTGLVGGRVAVFTVSLAQPAANAVSVAWSTTAAPASPDYVQAVSPTDYLAASGTVLFAPGVQSQQIRVFVRPEAVATDGDFLGTDFTSDFSRFSPIPPTSAFAVRISDKAGAIVLNALGIAIIPGSDASAIVGLLDFVGIADGTAPSGSGSTGIGVPA
jgi:hypothetical protein